ncbi:MAG: hypothetical protein E7291_01000 [Lachnospiraceae bacterium]|nr:hypothetical protein [Lachnospiraceae bacterium]
MQYLSCYYWQQEKPARTSLVLQQFMSRRSKLPILFSCICTAENSERGIENEYYARQLTDWFRYQGMEVLRKRRESSGELEGLLRQQFARIDGELAEYSGRGISEQAKEVSVVGLVCIGEQFWLFQRGRVSGCLLNDRFGKSHCTYLTNKTVGEFRFLTGAMETNIGLLIVTESLAERLSKQQVEACLEINELTSAGKGKCRLQELSYEAEKCGGSHMGAVLLVTR